MTTDKVCSKCGVRKSLGDFSPQKGGAHGVRARCKKCNAAYRASQTDKVAAAAAAREYRKKNPDRACAAVKKYRDRNKAKISEQERKYRKNNPEKITVWNSRAYEKDRENRIAYAAEWQKKNPGKVSARTSRRRAAKLQATPPWVDYDAIMTVYIEAAKLTIETGIPHEVDHIVPLKNKRICGLHVPWNLRVIPAEDNRRKSNKFPET